MEMPEGWKHLNYVIIVLEKHTYFSYADRVSQASILMKKNG